MVYSYNKRQRVLRRCFRLLERVKLLSSDLIDFGLYNEYLQVIDYIELLFPVKYEKPFGHGL